MLMVVIVVVCGGAQFVCGSNFEISRCVSPVQSTITSTLVPYANVQ